MRLWNLCDQDDRTLRIVVQCCWNQNYEPAVWWFALVAALNPDAHPVHRAVVGLKKKFRQRRAGRWYWDETRLAEHPGQVVVGRCQRWTLPPHRMQAFLPREYRTFLAEILRARGACYGELGDETLERLRGEYELAWNVFADYLEERGDPLVDFIRCRGIFEPA